MGTLMSTVKVQSAQVRAHPRSLLAGGLGVFASLGAIAWARWAYNLPSAVNLTSSQSQNLMLVQVGLGFVTLVGSGLMLARYTAAGGTINVLGAVGTFIIGAYYSSDLANAATAKDLTSLPLKFSDYYSNTVQIPTDRIVSTFLVVPVLPIALLLLISGLGALATFRSSRRI